MSNITKASHQWATRPDDERYTSLLAMADHFHYQRDHSRGVVVPSRIVTLEPETNDSRGILVTSGDNGRTGFAPTHWSFGQLAQLAGAPGHYLRDLPSPIAADCLNFGLKHKRGVEDVGLLLYKDGHNEMRAATGPNYGRVWNSDVVDALIDKFGDGVTGDWKVPGEFGKNVEITKANTTLYASDRDMFVFLADEKNHIEMPNRRNGRSGSLARGFFVWNSEVGKCSLGIGTFLFDFVCCNRIVWGSEMYQEIRVRHTVSAPTRWLEEVQPVLLAYSEASADPIQTALENAQKKKIDDVDEFLANRFGRGLAASFKKISELEENHPIETLWDAATAVTAYARGVRHTDARVDLERQAGELIALAQ